jgi:hypothetical protein
MSSEAHQKVTASHLRRNAYLYVRQSTVRQVLENRESTEVFRAGATRPYRMGRPANERCAGRLRPGSSALGGHHRSQEPHSEPRETGPTTPSSRKKGL